MELGKSRITAGDLCGTHDGILDDAHKALALLRPEPGLEFLNGCPRRLKQCEDLFVILLEGACADTCPFLLIDAVGGLFHILRIGQDIQLLLSADLRFQWQETHIYQLDGFALDGLQFGQLVPVLKLRLDASGDFSASDFSPAFSQILVHYDRLLTRGHLPRLDPCVD